MLPNSYEDGDMVLLPSGNTFLEAAPRAPHANVEVVAPSRARERKIERLR